MKIVEIDQNTAEWEEFRRGKITGSKLGNIVPRTDSGKRKDGFYQLVADQIAITPDGEPPIDRGHRLEEEAIEQFENLTGKKTVKNSVIWVSDENENMMVSPDAYIKPEKGKKVTEAVEIKCLASHKHIRAIDEDKYPDEYREQIYQYFIINTDLEILYFVMYDDRVPSRPIHVIEVYRDVVEPKLQHYIDYQKQVLDDVSKLVELLAF